MSLVFEIRLTEDAASAAAAEAARQSAAQSMAQTAAAPVTPSVAPAAAPPAPPAPWPAALAPPPTAPPLLAREPDDGGKAYAEYHGLRNRLDMGGRGFRPQDHARLAELEAKLGLASESSFDASGNFRGAPAAPPAPPEAHRPAPPPPPPPAAGPIPLAKEPLPAAYQLAPEHRGVADPREPGPLPEGYGLSGPPPAPGTAPSPVAFGGGAVADPRQNLGALAKAASARREAGRLAEEKEDVPLAEVATPEEAGPLRAVEEARKRLAARDASKREKAEAAEREKAVQEQMEGQSPEYAAEQESAERAARVGDLGKLLGKAGMGNLGGLLGSVSKLMGKGGAAGGAGAAAAGEAAAGGGAALAGEAAAGPAGLAVEAAKQANHVMAEVYEGARKGVQLLGDTAADAAGNNHMGAFNRVVDAGAEGLKKVPIVGEKLAAQLELAVQPLRSFVDVTNAFVERGKVLAQYSPDVAVARATADVRGTFADVRESNELGPGIARLTDAQSRFSDSFRELLEPIKKYIVEKLANVMEYLADAMESVVKDVQLTAVATQGSLKLLVDIATVSPWQAVKDLRDTVARIQEILDRANKPLLDMDARWRTLGDDPVPDGRPGDGLVPGGGAAPPIVGGF